MKLAEVPKPDAHDHALAIIKGLISSVPLPFLPGVAAEMFSILFTPPLERRWETWATSLAERLAQLQEKIESLSLERLSDSEVFVTVVLKATHLAVRNHQQEKLEALRNAVLNSALPNAPEDDVQLIFLELVDVLTTWHLRIFRLFDDPLKWAEDNQCAVPMGWGAARAVQMIIQQAYPELYGNDGLQTKIIKDLSTYGLAEISSSDMVRKGPNVSRSSKFGKQFLQFITSPL